MASAAEATPRQFVTKVTTRGASLFFAVALAALAGLMVLLYEGSAWLWAAPAVLLLAAPAVAYLLFPVATWWLEGDTLVAQVGRVTTRLDLSRLRSARRDFVPNKGDDLVLTDASGSSIRLWAFDAATESLRRAVGQRASLTGPNGGLDDPKTRRLLVLDG